MKKVLTSLFAVSAAATLMTSCKKEAMPLPNENTAATANEAAITAGACSFIPAPVYVLLRNGFDSLTYQDDGRLAKLQHTVKPGYTLYSYGVNTVTAKNVHR